MAMRRDLRLWTNGEIAAVGTLAGLLIGIGIGVFLMVFGATWLGLHPEARLEQIVATGGAMGALIGSFSSLTRD